MHVSRCNTGLIYAVSDIKKMLVKRPQLIIVPCRSLTHHKFVVAYRLNLYIIIPSCHFAELIVVRSRNHGTEKLAALTRRAEYNAVPSDRKQASRHERTAVEAFSM